MKPSSFNIADLIFKSLRENLSEQEKKQLKDWREASPDNDQLYQKLGDKSHYVEKKKMHKRLESLKNYPQVQNHIRKEKRKRWVRYASISAAAVIFLAMGNWLFFHHSLKKEEQTFTKLRKEIQPGHAVAVLETSEGTTINLTEENIETVRQGDVEVKSQGNVLAYLETKEKKSKEAKKETYNTLYIPRGGEYNLKLSDGTHVWLNSETTIKYPVQFLKDKREVQIAGEAYFDVAHNPKKPFVVHTVETQIEVLGTEFNLRAYSDENYVQATLVNGRITAQSGKRIQAISPSQQYTYNKEQETCTVKNVDVNMYTSWKDGVFLFDSKRLDYILSSIARWYDVEFIYEDAILKSYVFSGRLRKYENANSLLDIFEDTGNIVFIEKKGKIHIMKKK